MGRKGCGIVVVLLLVILMLLFLSQTGGGRGVNLRGVMSVPTPTPTPTPTPSPTPPLMFLIKHVVGAVILALLEFFSLTILSQWALEGDLWILGLAVGIFYVVVFLLDLWASAQGLKMVFSLPSPPALFISILLSLIQILFWLCKVYLPLVGAIFLDTLLDSFGLYPFSSWLKDSTYIFVGLFLFVEGFISDMLASLLEDKET